MRTRLIVLALLCSVAGVNHTVQVASGVASTPPDEAKAPPVPQCFSTTTALVRRFDFTRAFP